MPAVAFDHVDIIFGTNRDAAFAMLDRGASREEVIGITFWCRHAGGEFTMCEEHDRAEWLGFDKAIVRLGDNGAAAAVARIQSAARA